MLALALATAASDGVAFPHVVRQGESVAQIAEQIYGKVELERVLVAANGLGGRRGSSVVPGMRLELPAVGYHKVLAGESWQSIASELLGDKRRGDVLSQVNESHPWLKPAVGREIVVPYNLRYVASRGDTTQTVAYRFLGRRDKAWFVTSYNNLRRARLRQGEVILVPLTELPLTELGRHAALTAGALVRSQGAGSARQSQRLANSELPLLALDVRRGRYVEAVARGAGLLARGGLSNPQMADVYRLLTVAYVALSAGGPAATACARWRQYDPTAVLDPIDHSPKVLAVCIGDADTAGVVPQLDPVGSVGDGGAGSPPAPGSAGPLPSAGSASSRPTRQRP